MKILVIHWSLLSHFPPVISLVNNLLNNGHEVILFTKDEGKNNLLYNFQGKFEYQLISTDIYSRITGRISNYIIETRKTREKIKRLIPECDIVWTTTDNTVARVGEILLGCKHVMQLMELIEYVPYVNQIQFIHFNIKKYAQMAYKVVVPEYNRAHIQKTWWELKKMAVVLPNKPYYRPLADGDISEDTLAIIEEMRKEKRKILLYQGVFHGDRNLDTVAYAVSQMSDRYCMYIMGRDNDYSRRLCSNYPNIIRVPFINPPYHMCITKNADIGLMPYIAKKTFHYSSLNALYCAPNKVFEYAAFGLPILGSNVPGIAIPFQMYKMGYVYEESVESIMQGLEAIDDNYESMKINALRYYDSIDLDKIVESILND